MTIEYKEHYDIIIDPKKQFYFPRTERWIMDSFGLDVEQAVLYQVILNNRYLTWTLDYIADAFGWSRAKAARQLDNMVAMGIIIRHTIQVNESGKRRSYYLAKYTKEGRRPLAEQEAIEIEARKSLKQAYSTKRFYNKDK